MSAKFSDAELEGFSFPYTMAYPTVMWMESEVFVDDKDRKQVLIDAFIELVKENLPWWAKSFLWVITKGLGNKIPKIVLGALQKGLTELGL